MFEQLKRRVTNKTIVALPVDYLVEITDKLTTEEIHFELVNNNVEIDKADVIKVDQIIKETILPNLLPAQWHWLLAISGLEAAIDVLLEALKTTDPEKYAMYKGFLNGARFYEFPKALAMLDQAKPVIEAAYPELDLTIPTLKALWQQAAQF